MSDDAGRLARRSPTTPRGLRAPSGVLGVLAAHPSRNPDPSPLTRLPVDRVVEVRSRQARPRGSRARRPQRGLPFRAYGARGASREPMTLMVSIWSLTSRGDPAMMTLVSKGGPPERPRPPTCPGSSDGRAPLPWAPGGPSRGSGPTWTRGPGRAMTAIALAAAWTPVPGDRFIYSDINYFLLRDRSRDERRAVGRYTERRCSPRLPCPTRLLPAGPAPRIARPSSGDGPVAVQRPTRALRGWCRPTARRMGGVAGHAGCSGRPGSGAVCPMLLAAVCWTACASCPRRLRG
jgi:hypothetical protein